MSDKKYKDTLNLPKTAFSMRANLAQREPGFLEGWQKEGLAEAIQKKGEGKPTYTLHDGPPYANGRIHIGHALNKILKDIVVKYKTMRGFKSVFVPGWDCHGLPIEHALFKELKIKKDDIDQVEFRQKARAYAQKYIDIQREDFKRLGVFAEWDDPYLTMNYGYQAAIIESFGSLYARGYIYKGEKPIHWCSACETALAEAELEYMDKVSDSVFVRFPVLLDKSSHVGGYETLKEKSNGKQLFVLIWTTTPWTLPANVAIAFHPDLEYVLFENSATGDQYLFAADLCATIQEKTGMTDGVVLDRFRGKDLEHIVYRHPFIERTSHGVLADYVSNVDGSGCVHIAPGHGQEDYQVGLQYSLPIISPVNEKGLFTKEFPLAEGQYVLKANQVIIDMLDRDGNLLCHEKIEHSYPHCWRCKNPVIFRATKQWFLNVEHKNLRQTLIDAVNDSAQTEWVPQWGKNRINAMLESRPDWCLSRQRYWGVPIPIVYCTECETEFISDAMISHLVAQVEKDGADVWFTSSADQLVPAGTACQKCGATTFKKENDILDVWFDSGVSHQAVLRKREALAFPSDLYLEGSDQHRGWFQTSLITALALEKKAPFKHVVTHGFVVDGAGKKMSKSAGNVVAPQNIIKNFGADILRLWVSSCDISQDVKISDDIVKQMSDAYRKIRNTLRFLLGNLGDFNYKQDRVAYDEMDAVDKWALGKCLLLVAEVTKNYESFRFHSIYRLVYNFCVVEMSSFYLDVLKDRMYTAKSDSRERRSSQTAMFYIVRNLVKILAPILSFTTDELWRVFCVEEGVSSVHLADWPGEYPDMIDQALIDDWDRLREFRDTVNPCIEKKREQEIIGSSLEAKVSVSVYAEDDFNFLTKHKDALPLVLVVSQVEIEKADSAESNGGELVCDVSGEKRYMVCVDCADGQKCERCWNYSNAVGSDSVYPDLCPKCISALQ